MAGHDPQHGPGDDRRGYGNQRRGLGINVDAVGIIDAALGMNVANRDGTSSMPEIADNTINHPLQCVSIATISILPAVTIMSMAIHRTSANVVPAMLNPVTKLSKVAKFGSGSSKSGATQAPDQASRPQPADTPRTADQVHMAFKYASANLSSLGTTGSTPAQQSTEGQAGGIQHAGRAAYTQGEQQAGQTLDLTA